MKSISLERLDEIKKLRSTIRKLRKEKARLEWKNDREAELMLEEHIILLKRLYHRNWEKQFWNLTLRIKKRLNEITSK